MRRYLKSFEQRRGLGTVLVLLLALLLPTLLQSEYWIRVLDLGLIYALVAMGLQSILGWTGQLSLGQSVFYGVGAYTTAILTTKYGMPFVGGLVISVVTAGIAGLIVGFPSVRVKGHYLALVTMGAAGIFELLLMNWKDLTRGHDGIGSIPPISIAGLELKGDTRSYYFLLLFVAMAAVTLYRLLHSTWGRVFAAIRDGEVAAEASGVDPARIKLLAFVVGAMYTGAAGSLFAAWQGYIHPSGFGLHVSLVALYMIVVGGMGSIAGALTGAVVLTLVQELLRAYESIYLLIYAAMVMVMIRVAPKGLSGLAAAFWTRLVGRPADGAAENDESTKSRMGESA